MGDSFPFSRLPFALVPPAATKIDARGIVRPETELSSIRGVDEGGGVGGKGMFEMRHAGLTRIGLE